MDTYIGKEINSLGLTHSVVQVIPLPLTDSTEQRLHLLLDVNQHAHLYPRSLEAISIFQHEFPIYTGTQLIQKIASSEGMF